MSDVASVVRLGIIPNRGGDLYEYAQSAVVANAFRVTSFRARDTSAELFQRWLEQNIANISNEDDGFTTKYESDPAFRTFLAGPNCGPRAC